MIFDWLDATSPSMRLEAIEIIRAITAGKRLEYHGEIHNLPRPEAKAVPSAR